MAGYVHLHQPRRTLLMAQICHRTGGQPRYSGNSPKPSPNVATLIPRFLISFGNVIWDAILDVIWGAYLGMLLRRHLERHLDVIFDASLTLFRSH